MTDGTQQLTSMEAFSFSFVYVPGLLIIITPQQNILSTSVWDRQHREDWVGGCELYEYFLVFTVIYSTEFHQQLIYGDAYSQLIYGVTQCYPEYVKSLITDDDDDDDNIDIE